MIKQSSIYSTHSFPSIAPVTGSDVIVNGTSVTDVIEVIGQLGLYIRPEPNLEHEFPELKHARLAVNHAIIEALGEEVKSRLAAHRALRQKCKNMQDIERELRG